MEEAGKESARPKRRNKRSVGEPRTFKRKNNRWKARDERRKRVEEKRGGTGWEKGLNKRPGWGGQWAGKSLARQKERMQKERSRIEKEGMLHKTVIVQRPGRQQHLCRLRNGRCERERGWKGRL